MKTLSRSFAGGEITPEMYGRMDLSKYQTGVARADNFLVLPHGPLDRRPGFYFQAETKDSTKVSRLLPFAFSATQTVLLEFGHLYVRFHVDDATILEANQAIVSVVGSNVQVVGHGYATGDDVFITNRFYRITVVNANNFTVADRWGAAVTPAGTLVARVYTVTTPYTDADLAALRYTQSNDVLTLTLQAYAARELKRLGAANWTLSAISFAPPSASPTGVGAVATQPTAGAVIPYIYVVTSIDADGITESLPSATASCSNALGLAGNYNTITWLAVAGASRYRVYRKRGGTFGYIGSPTTLSIVDDNVLPDTSVTPPEDVYALNTGAGDYPATVTYYEQRRWFASTANQPQHIWATRSGSESNLTSSIPSQADDALLFRIASQQQNEVRHLLPLSDVIALTVGAEFRIFADGAPSITPESLSRRPQGYSGAAAVTPALTPGSILYVQALGARLRELAYNWQSSAYVSIDLSIMAPHLFDGYTIVDMAYASAPIPCLWVVRSDGVLLSLTYVPEQQVYGWAQHHTDGTFESVACITRGDESALHAIVKRTVDSRDVRYIERLSKRVFLGQENAFFVDSGLTYDGAPTSTLSGLWHLEGREVLVLGDGAVLATQTVVDGALTLDAEYSVVHVGLGYTSQAQLLPASMLQAEAGGQMVTKSVTEIEIRVSRSSAFSAGPDFDHLTEYPDRSTTDPYDSPPALRTDSLRLPIAGEWDADAAPCIEMSLPLPLTILAVTLDVATGG